MSGLENLPWLKRSVEWLESLPKPPQVPLGNSALYFSEDKRLLISDTPGSNPLLADKLQHNMWIAIAINYRPVSRILISVKADVRIDNVIDGIRKYVENFLDLAMMEQVLAVCVTHMDQVEWRAEEFLPMLENELGLVDCVVFSGLQSTGM